MIYTIKNFEKNRRKIFAKMKSFARIGGEGVASEPGGSSW